MSRTPRARPRGRAAASRRPGRRGPGRRSPRRSCRGPAAPRGPRPPVPRAPGRPAPATACRASRARSTARRTMVSPPSSSWATHASIEATRPRYGLVVWVIRTACAVRPTSITPSRRTRTELWDRLVSSLWVLVTAASAPAAIASTARSRQKRRCGPHASSTANGTAQRAGDRRQLRQVAADPGVRGAHHPGEGGVRVPGQGGGEVLGVDARADPGLADPRRHPDRAGPGEHERGVGGQVRVPGHDDLVAGREGGQQQRVVAARGPVDQGEGAVGAPQPGDPLLEVAPQLVVRRGVQPDVAGERAVPDHLAQRRQRAGPALVPGAGERGRAEARAEQVEQRGPHRGAAGGQVHQGAHRAASVASAIAGCPVAIAGGALRWAGSAMVCWLAWATGSGSGAGEPLGASTR